MTDLHVGTRGRVESPTSYELPSGTFVELLDPHPEDILLEDIAHNLAEEPRYGGTCSPRVSVAQHVVMVARELRRRGTDSVTVLLGLHHDDPEAFLKDLHRPLKLALEKLAPGAYKGLEAMFAARISVALGLDVPVGDGSVLRGSYAAVTEADQWALGVEAAMTMPSGGKGWVQIRPQDRVDGEAQARSSWGDIRVSKPEKAARMYLEEHDRCMAEAKAHAARLLEEAR